MDAIQNAKVDELVAKTGGVKMIFIIMILMLILSTALYIYTKSRFVSKQCDNITSLYEDLGHVRSLDPSDPNVDGFLLRDFYIKTAYNSCALGSFKNSFVSECILKQVIRQGARCLDFEIYSINDQPVVAVSTQEDFNIKESFNYIKFSEAMRIVNDYCFSGSNCPNPKDPVLLHFRIKSTNNKMYKNMTDILLEKLKERLLGNEYNNENHGENLGAVEINKVMEKIIIIVDKTNNFYEHTELDEYVNIASNSIFMRALRDYDVKYTPDHKELTEFNRKHMTFTMPDMSSNIDNMKSTIHMQYGCQMIGMSYQKYDDNLQFYESFFGRKGHAFVLKPKALRYIPVTIDEPKPQDKRVSYANRNVSADYYGFTI
tara:strand:- start:698 stop:1816 length:1119 start_codon:yes stop_codon:yes gene_type:complete